MKKYTILNIRLEIIFFHNSTDYEILKKDIIDFKESKLIRLFNFKNIDEWGEFNVENNNYNKLPDKYTKNDYIFIMIAYFYYYKIKNNIPVINQIKKNFDSYMYTYKFKFDLLCEQIIEEKFAINENLKYKIKYLKYKIKYLRYKNL
jgi:hypothetical protein